MLLCSVLCLQPISFAAALSITATSAYVMDADTGETLYEQNADLRRTPASMTKVLTSYIVHQELEKGTLTLDTQVPISANAAAISKNANYPLSVPLTQSSYSVDTLLTLLHVPSASGACVALAEAVSGSEAAFVSRMNATAQQLGLDAVYYNVHGCGPNKITARSQAKLTRHFIDTYPAVLRYTAQSSVTFEGKTYTNGNTLLGGNYAGADGFKTGTFGDSGYCLSSTAVRGGRRVIAIAMNANSRATRISDSAQLLDLGFAEIARRDASRAATQVTLSPSGSARTFAPITVTADLSGLTAVYYCKARWYINGNPVPGYGNDNFYAKNGRVSTLQYVPNGTEGDTLTISLTLTMPDGAERTGTVTLPLEHTALTLGGNLNPSAVTCYPGVSIPVKAVIAADAPLSSLRVSASWQLDGQPIPGFSNPLFRIDSGAATSAYTLTLPADAAPGSHTLSLVLAEGSAAEHILSCEITLLDAAEAAA